MEKEIDPVKESSSLAVKLGAHVTIALLSGAASLVLLIAGLWRWDGPLLGLAAYLYVVQQSAARSIREVKAEQSALARLVKLRAARAA